MQCDDHNADVVLMDHDVLINYSAYSFRYSMLFQRITQEFNLHIDGGGCCCCCCCHSREKQPPVDNIESPDTLSVTFRGDIWHQYPQTYLQTPGGPIATSTRDLMATIAWESTGPDDRSVSIEYRVVFLDGSEPGPYQELASGLPANGGQRFLVLQFQPLNVDLMLNCNIEYRPTVRSGSDTQSGVVQRKGTRLPRGTR